MRFGLKRRKKNTISLIFDVKLYEDCEHFVPAKQEKFLKFKKRKTEYKGCLNNGHLITFMPDNYTGEVLIIILKLRSLLLPRYLIIVIQIYKLH